MHSDSFFVMGKTHSVCQDYALAGKLAVLRNYAVLSDGCSSSAHTDFGARLIAAAAIACAESGVLAPTSVCALAKMSKPDFFSTSILDATLLFAIETRIGVAVEVYGDGFVIARRRDGVIEGYSNDFGNAPPYMTYLLDNDRMQEYLKYNGGKLSRVYIETSDAAYRTIHGETAHESTTHKETKVEELNVAEPTIAQFCTWAYSSRLFETNKYDLVVLASDGLASFIDSKDEAEPVENLVRNLLDIKTFTGEFMLRRGKRFVKSLADRGLHNYDDLSLAAIYLGELK